MRRCDKDGIQTARIRGKYITLNGYGLWERLSCLSLSTMTNCRITSSLTGAAELLLRVIPPGNYVSMAVMANQDFDWLRMDIMEDAVNLDH